MTGNLHRSISVCICTRNRAEDVALCLESISNSTIAVDEVIISDDSTEDVTKSLLAANFPFVKYAEGPRTGLGANRNNALAQATSDFVLFLDDDARLAPDYVEKAFAALDAAEPKGKIIVSGLENNRGEIVYPQDQNFFGFQVVPYNDTSRINTIVINSTIFPRQLFDEIQFDSNLVYGYEEVDFASRAAGLGYKIVLCEDAINLHFPSSTNRSYYVPYKDASRIYVTFNRYRKTERSPLKAAAFLVIAAGHLFAARVKANGLSGIGSAFKSLKLTSSYMFR